VIETSSLERKKFSNKIMQKPSRKEAENAVKLLLSYIGEDTNREGLIDTPSRVVKSYIEVFSGYNAKIEEILDKKFYDIDEYNDIVLLRGIKFTSLCEHHMLPFSGAVDIAYIPDGVIIGISKLARLVDAFAKRLQVQEKMTSSIANSLQEHLKPQGVAIRVSATHSCMSMRGVLKTDSVMETTHFTGIYNNEQKKRKEFLAMLRCK